MPLNNFGVVTPLLYRCAQPDADGLDALEHLHVDGIITLNGATDSGFSRDIWPYNLPTFSVDVPKIEAIADHIQSRLSIAERLVVHCQHGRDRTGLVIGAWRIRHCGWSLEQVHTERDLFGSGSLVVEFATGDIERALRTIWQRKHAASEER